MKPDKTFYTVTRETSKYNKYMKWHLQYYRENKTLLASQWFKTQKEAIARVDHSIWRGKQGFPIGNRMSYTDYEPLAA